MKMICIGFALLVVAGMACDRTTPDLPNCLSASSEFKPENCPDNGDCSFEYYADSKLEIRDEEQYLSFEITQGENLVFHFKYKKSDHPMIMDDEYEEGLYFEIKPSGNSFLISGEDLRKAGALFSRMCFCPDAGHHRINEGCIYGYKVSDRTWNVSMNLTANTEFSSYTRMKQKDFIKKQRPE